MSSSEGQVAGGFGQIAQFAVADGEVVFEKRVVPWGFDKPQRQLKSRLVLLVCRFQVFQPQGHVSSLRMGDHGLADRLRIIEIRAVRSESGKQLRCVVQQIATDLSCSC